jgi:phytoene synthase
MTTPTTEPTDSDAAYCAALVRADDRDRYLAAQLAPPVARTRLIALLAVNAEVARVAQAAREPLLAEMRLNWWRDAILAALGGIAPAQPALAAFARAAADSGLSVDALADSFDRLIAARVGSLVGGLGGDLGAEPSIDADTAVARAGALSAAIAETALALLGVTDDTARRAACAAGVAYALAGMNADPILALVGEHVTRARADRPRDVRAALPVLLWATAAEARARRRARGRPPYSPWLPLRLAWASGRGRY